MADSVNQWADVIDDATGRAERSHYNRMLLMGAREGQEHMCRRAKTNGATDYGGMLLSAARGGHPDLCALAIAWGSPNYHDVIACTDALRVLNPHSVTELWVDEKADEEE
jgi:hypothetical protein